MPKKIPPNKDDVNLVLAYYPHAVADRSESTYWSILDVPLSKGGPGSRNLGGGRIEALAWSKAALNVKKAHP